MRVQKNQAPTPTAKWGAMLAVGISVFMGTLDMSIVNVSLPTLVQQLHTKFATIQWVILSYVLVITAGMMSAARLGDMWDKKKFFKGGLILFTFGSLFCGLSPHVGWLIASRAIQGCGAVIMQALGMAIIVEVFPARERGRALGIMGSIVSVGIATGPAIGGMVIGLLGWRWIFLINLPFGLLAIVASWHFLPPSPPYGDKQSFDVLGAIILFLTLGSFALGMTLGQNQGFGNTLVRTILFISCAGIVVFVLVEKRQRQPMVDPALFHNMLLGINLLMGLLSFIMLGGMFLIPFFLELVKHYTPQKLGLLMMMVPVAMGLTAPIAGTLSDHFGPRIICLIGLLIMVGGCLSIGSLHAEVGVLGYLMRMAPLGIGIGVFQSPNNSAIMGAAPPKRVGVVSGLLALSRTLGQTTGIPLMGAIFSTSVLAEVKPATLPDITAAPAEALVIGLTHTYRIGALMISASLLLAVLALWKDRRRKEPSCEGKEMRATPERPL